MAHYHRRLAIQPRTLRSWGKLGDLDAYVLGRIYDYMGMLYGWESERSSFCLILLYATATNPGVYSIRKYWVTKDMRSACTLGHTRDLIVSISMATAWIGKRLQWTRQSAEATRTIGSVLSTDASAQQ